jgi:hypothetical protein
MSSSTPSSPRSRRRPAAILRPADECSKSHRTIACAILRRSHRRHITTHGGEGGCDERGAHTHVNCSNPEAPPAKQTVKQFPEHGRKRWQATTASSNLHRLQAARGCAYRPGTRASATACAQSPASAIDVGGASVEEAGTPNDQGREGSLASRAVRRDSMETGRAKCCRLISCATGLQTELKVLSPEQAKALKALQAGAPPARIEVTLDLRRSAVANLRFPVGAIKGTQPRI